MYRLLDPVSAIRRWSRVLPVACGIFLSISQHPTQTPAQPAAPAQADETAPFNLPFKTLGGKQFWTDLRVQGDWRIQRNSETDHYRLLDDHNIRRAWGSYQQCAASFEAAKVAGKIRPLPQHVVLLLHGLMGSRSLLTPLQERLRKQGIEALCVTYASTRRSIDAHARALSQVIQHLGPGVTRVDFVAHSMGNIVIRRYLRTLPVGSSAQRRIDCFVMLAPPNHGAQIAKLLRDNAVFRLVTGDSGQQLGEFHRIEEFLAIPLCAFGIVAGGGSTRNPLLSGDDDLLVGIEETKLVGARDFIVVDSLHRTLPKHERTIEYVHRFLTKGHFVSEQKRHPLPAKPVPQR